MNYISGKNGQGKTNVLEALHVLSHVRSFRTVNNRELIAWEKEEGSCFGGFQTLAGTLDVGVVFAPSGRQVFLQGEPISKVGDFLGRVLSISFSPYDLGIVRGAPQERRRFFNRYMSLFRPKYFELSVRLERVLRNKRILLKSSGSNAQTLYPWNTLLADVSFQIATERRRFLDELSPYLRQYSEMFSPGDGILSIALTGDPYTREGAVHETDDILENILKHQNRELQQQTCCWGPHRDDFVFYLGTTRAREFGSQGQVRSALLVTLLSILDLLEKKYGEKAIVLLDDVESELDSERAALFLKYLASSDRQIVITGTEATQTQAALREVRVLEVCNGAVRGSSAGI